tara:strand:- start:4936 stop:5370 length:435 start_codon:yes stop_codon:yes gene_type:complete
MVDRRSLTALVATLFLAVPGCGTDSTNVETPGRALPSRHATTNIPDKSYQPSVYIQGVPLAVDATTSQNGTTFAINILVDGVEQIAVASGDIYSFDGATTSVAVQPRIDGKTPITLLGSYRTDDRGNQYFFFEYIEAGPHKIHY